MAADPIQQFFSIGMSCCIAVWDRYTGWHGRCMPSQDLCVLLHDCWVAGGAPNTVPALCEKVGNFRPVFPYGQGDCSTFCVPIPRTAQILTMSKNSDNELKQTMFHTENARLLSESAVSALWTYASPVAGGFQGGHGTVILLLGAVRLRPLRPAGTTGQPSLTNTCATLTKSVG